MSATIHLLRTPSETLATADDDRADRFCFQCRRRLPHSWQIVGDPDPSYYDPIPVVVCSGCGEDHTCFPGCEGDGPRAPSDAVCDALNADRRRRRSIEAGRRRVSAPAHDTRPTGGAHAS